MNSPEAWLSDCRDKVSLLGTEFFLRCYSAAGIEQWETPTPGVAWATNAAMNDQLAVTAYGDGVIRWQRTTDGLGILAFFPHADQKRWVTWAVQFQPAGLLGAQINDQSGKPVITQVTRGLPAAMAGIRQFDEIQQIDGGIRRRRGARRRDHSGAPSRFPGPHGGAPAMARDSTGTSHWANPSSRALFWESITIARPARKS